MDITFLIYFIIWFSLYISVFVIKEKTVSVLICIVQALVGVVFGLILMNTTIFSEDVIGFGVIAIALGTVFIKVMDEM